MSDKTLISSILTNNGVPKLKETLPKSPLGRERDNIMTPSEFILI